MFPSDFNKRDGDGATVVAMISLLSPRVDVLTDVSGKETGLSNRNLYVVLNNSRVWTGGAVRLVLLIYSYQKRSFD